MFFLLLVIVQLSGNYGNKQTESEGNSLRTWFVYVDIIIPDNCTIISSGTYLIGQQNFLGLQNFFSHAEELELVYSLTCHHSSCFSRALS